MCVCRDWFVLFNFIPHLLCSALLTFFHLFGISPCWQIELIAFFSAVEMEGCSCP